MYFLYYILKLIIVESTRTELLQIQNLETVENIEIFRIVGDTKCPYETYQEKKYFVDFFNGICSDGCCKFN